MYRWVDHAAEVELAIEAARAAGRSGTRRLSSGLAEEAPEAYKDVKRVVEVVERAGLAARVARLRPIGVIKA